MHCYGWKVLLFSWTFWNVCQSFGNLALALGQFWKKIVSRCIIFSTVAIVPARCNTFSKRMVNLSESNCQCHVVVSRDHMSWEFARPTRAIPNKSKYIRTRWP